MPFGSSSAMCVTSPVSMSGLGCGCAVASLKALHHAFSDAVRALWMSVLGALAVGRCCHPFGFRSPPSRRLRSKSMCLPVAAWFNLRSISALLSALPNRSSHVCRSYLDFHGPSPSRWCCSSTNFQYGSHNERWNSRPVPPVDVKTIGTNSMPRLARRLS